MRRVEARRALALLGAGVLLAFGASDASWVSTTHAARSDAASRSPAIRSGSARSAQSATEAFREPDYAAVGRSSSESSRLPIGYVALAAMVAAPAAFRRRASARRARPDFFLVSWLRSRAPPALSLV